MSTVAKYYLLVTSSKPLILLRVLSVADLGMALASLVGQSASRASNPERTKEDRPMNQTKPTFKDAQVAFHQAIAAGRLSANPASVTYAGHFMYMGTYGDRDLFKHVTTRQYLD